MARRNFGAMLETIDRATEIPESPEPPSRPQPTQKAAVAPSAPAAKTKVDKSPARPAQTRKAARAASAQPQGADVRGVAGGVGFDKLERKETRLSADQYAELTTIARGLNRSRAGEGHRITENTLIRLGIDLLRERAGDLSGTTEDELRASLGLE